MMSWDLNLQTSRSMKTLMSDTTHNTELHRFYIELALNLAVRGEGHVKPNPLVGAVIVNDAKIVGHGFHIYDQIKHAEALALEQAGSLANGATVYVKENLRSYAGKELEDRGVELRLGEAVAEIGPTSVKLKSGEEIKTHTLIWAAGVRANPLADMLGLPQGRGGRVKLNPDLSVPDHSEIVVVGEFRVARRSLSVAQRNEKPD